MLCIALPLPEPLKAVVFEMGFNESENFSAEPIALISFDEVANDLKLTPANYNLATIEPPDLKPADLSDIRDPIFNPVPQAGTSSLSDMNPADLMTNLAPERLGTNTDMMNVGNPLKGLTHGNGTGGYSGDAENDLKRLAAYGAKTGKVTVSLIWDTHDDLDLHLVKDRLLPRLGNYDFKDMVSYRNKINKWGTLDIDMNVRPFTNTPVENIYMPALESGSYGIYVHYYASHTRMPLVKFRVLIQREGENKPLVIPGSVSWAVHNNKSQLVHQFQIP